MQLEAYGQAAGVPGREDAPGISRARPYAKGQIRRRQTASADAITDRALLEADGVDIDRGGPTTAGLKSKWWRAAVRIPSSS